MAKRAVVTGFTSNEQEELLLAVMGQMSDGKWENTKGYDKYWEHADIETLGGNVCIVVDDEYGSGFKGMTDTQVRRFFARKIRAVVKDFLDWNNCGVESVCDYLTYTSSYSCEWCLKMANKLSKFKEVDE